MSTELHALFDESFIKESMPQFIRKIYLLLEDRQHQDIIAWDSDNRTIVIKDSDRIVKEVLPVLFNQNTLKSFVRQLNMYNFKKVKKSYKPEWQCFQNQHFVRGNLESLIFIKRKTRGYVEKTKLENEECKSILENYNIFACGVLNKLKDDFMKLSEHYPGLETELENLSKISTVSINNIAEDPNNRQTFHPYYQHEILFHNVLESFQSLYSIPALKSNFSLGGQLL